LKIALIVAIIPQLKIIAIIFASILGVQVDANLNKSNNSIDVSHLTAGTYYLSLTTDTNQVIVTKFIKK
jgi:hypothetical protein